MWKLLYLSFRFQSICFIITQGFPSRHSVRASIEKSYSHACHFSASHMQSLQHGQDVTSTQAYIPEKLTFSKTWWPTATDATLISIFASLQLVPIFSICTRLCFSPDGIIILVKHRLTCLSTTPETRVWFPPNWMEYFCFRLFTFRLVSSRAGLTD